MIEEISDIPYSFTIQDNMMIARSENPSIPSVISAIGGSLQHSEMMCAYEDMHTAVNLDYIKNMCTEIFITYG